MSDPIQSDGGLDMDVLSALVSEATTDVMLAENRRADALKLSIEYWQGNAFLQAEYAPAEAVVQTAATFERYLKGESLDNVKVIRPVND